MCGVYKGYIVWDSQKCAVVLYNDVQQQHLLHHACAIPHKRNPNTQVPGPDDDNTSGKDTDTPMDSPHPPTESPRPTAPHTTRPPPHTRSHADRRAAAPDTDPQHISRTTSNASSGDPQQLSRRNSRGLLPLLEVFRTASDRLLLSTPPETPSGPPPGAHGASGLRRCTSCNAGGSVEGGSSQVSLPEVDPEAGGVSATPADESVGGSVSGSVGGSTTATPTAAEAARRGNGAQGR